MFKEVAEKAKVSEVAKSSYLFLVILISTNLYSNDFGGYYTFSNGYDSNPFILSNSKESYVVRNSIGLGYFPVHSEFAISYNANVNSYLNFSERNYHTHNIKSDYTFQPFKYPYFEVETSINSRARINSKDAIIYDYFDVNPEISFLLYSDLGIIDLSYSPKLTRFTNFRNLNNFQNEISIELEKSLETETDVIAGISYGIKNYFNSNYQFQSINEPRGKGKNYRRFSQNPQGNQLPNIVFTEQENSIIDMNLGVMQHITNSIYLGIVGNRNIHLNDEGFYYASGTTDLFNEREFFNDLYNYEETGINVFSKIIISEDIIFRASYNKFYRDYLYSLALINENYDDDIKRYDIGDYLSADVNFAVAEYITFIKNLNINIKFDYFYNQSNLLEYSFDTYSFMISTIFDF